MAISAARRDLVVHAAAPMRADQQARLVALLAIGLQRFLGCQGRTATDVELSADVWHYTDHADHNEAPRG
jgi:hypothetical protein